GEERRRRPAAWRLHHRGGDRTPHGGVAGAGERLHDWGLRPLPGARRLGLGGRRADGRARLSAAAPGPLGRTGPLWNGSALPCFVPVDTTLAPEYVRP